MFNTTKPFPPAPKWRTLIGPSFLILALGLGSGEIILWPYLVANYGLGIAWGAVLGLTFQYFINMEIERYALVKGESVFVGLRRLFPWSPSWFIVSTFLGFGLPGIAAAAAQILGNVFGVSEVKWLAIGLLISIGLVIGISRTVYSQMEKITQAIIILGVPYILLIAAYIVRGPHLAALAGGLIGRGDGYWFMPAGIGLATFLAAFAYSGAGGNLNLTQSIYIKEKGYGMGKYAAKMTGLFRVSRHRAEPIKLSGENFELSRENINNFKAWWREISLEHLVVFWGVGLFTIMLLMVVSYAAVYGLSGNAAGISFVLSEALMVGNNILPWVGGVFLTILAVMLYQTQMGVLDSTSRIMAENMALMEMDEQGEVKADLSGIYFTFLWLQIAFGTVLFALDYYEPKALLVLGAVINAVAMFVHVGLVWYLNRSLPAPVRPKKWRQILIAVIFIFLGVFSFITLRAEGIKYFRNLVATVRTLSQ